VVKANQNGVWIFTSFSMTLLSQPVSGESVESSQAPLPFIHTGKKPKCVAALPTFYDAFYSTITEIFLFNFLRTNAFLNKTGLQRITQRFFFTGKQPIWFCAITNNQSALQDRQDSRLTGL